MPYPDATAAYRAVMKDIERLSAGKACLVAVSKRKPPGAVMPLLEAGQRDFGENTVREATEKWPPLLKNYPGTRLHFIGRLQRNKAREAVRLFDTVHSLDSRRLADALAKAEKAEGRRRGYFIQVNTGREPQKGGCMPEETAALLSYASEAGLNVTGLTVIPPVEDNPRPHFAELRQQAAACGLSFLSMGMSADYRMALEEGATHIRVGALLFGARG